MSPLYISADIAKRTFVAAYWAGQRSQLWSQVDNQASGYTQLKLWVQQQQQVSQAEVVHLIVEPTGGYEQGLVAYARQQGWRVSLVNPKHLRDWANGLGQRAKTDRQDALLLAQYGAQRQPAETIPPPAETEALKALLDRREDLDKLLRQERNRLEAFNQQPHAPQSVRDSLEQVIAALEKALAELEQALQQFWLDQPDLTRQLKLLLAIPGVGLKLAPYLLVWCHRWAALTQGQGSAKGITALVGLDPRPFESGQTVFKPSRISKMGHSTMRSRLYLGALGGSRGHSPLGDFYRQLVKRGKAKKLALVAAARKILTWAWAVFRSNTPFDPVKAGAKSV
jgi:transposase